MHRIDANAHVGNMFSEGDPTVPRLPTQIDAAFMNAIQEEAVTAITDPGTALVKGTNTQLANALALMLGEPGGRLCVQSSTPPNPVTDDTADVVFYVPYKHSRIAVWNGSRWVMKAIPDAGSALIAIADTTLLAANTNFDVFAWDNAGTLAAMPGPAWASGTSRGTGAGTTELERKDGRWVNKVAISGGPAAQRGLYLGTVRTDGSSLVRDTVTHRHVWNAYNRVPRAMRVLPTTDSWSYNTNSYRQANADAANQLDMVIGLSEDAVHAQVLACLSNNDFGGGYVGIGLDSTSARVAGTIFNTATRDTGVGAGQCFLTVHAMWTGLPGIGRHTLVWLEIGLGTGTNSWRGDNGSIAGAEIQSGMWGVVRS